MLHRSFLDVNQSLFLVSKLLFDYTLTAEDSSFQLLQILVLAANLLTHNRGLMTELNLVLFLCPPYYIIHSG
jgi:hypothetical protein